MKSILFLLLISLLGCAENHKTVQLRDEARIKLFEKCMTLAAAMPRKHDDDVADIVSECDTAAYYQSNTLRTPLPSNS